MRLWRLGLIKCCSIGDYKRLEKSAASVCYPEDRGSWSFLNICNLEDSAVPGHYTMSIGKTQQTRNSSNTTERASDFIRMLRSHWCLD